MSKPQSLYSKWAARFAATPATVATHESKKGLCVATVATVAVANSDGDNAVNDPTVATVATVAVANRNTDAPAVDWHQADRAYQAHHLGCPTCTAAGKGHGQRCDEGQRLWAVYQSAPMPELGKAKRVSTSNQAPAPAPQTPPRMTPRSGAEIVRMIGLHRRALSVGLPDSNDTDKAIDRMMDAPSDMACCFACNHLRGATPQRWRCAGAGHELSGLPLARVFVVQLHRCPSYQPPEGTPT